MHRIGKMIHTLKVSKVVCTKLLRVEMEFDEIQNQFLNPWEKFQSTIFDVRLQYNMTYR